MRTGAREKTRRDRCLIVSVGEVAFDDVDMKPERAGNSRHEDFRTSETVTENATVANVRGFLLGIKAFKCLCGASAAFVGVMAVCMLVALGSVGGDSGIPLAIRMSIGFGQTFNVIFSLMIVLALVGPAFFFRYVRFLKYWGGLGVFMTYTGFQLFSYTQTSLGLLRAAALTSQGILKDTDALETAAEVAAYLLMSLGALFFLLALMCLQRLETAPTVGVRRTVVRDHAEGRKTETVELDKQLLEVEKRMPVTEL